MKCFQCYQISNVLLSPRISDCDCPNRRELSSLRQTVLEEKSAVDGFVAGLMEAVAEGGRGVGAEVDGARAEDAEGLARLRSQLEAKAEAAKDLEQEVEDCRRQVASSEEALSALRRAQESEAEERRAETEQERKREAEAVRVRLERAANAEKEAKRSLEEHQVEVETLRRKARLLEASQGRYHVALSKSFKMLYHIHKLHKNRFSLLSQYPMISE